MLADSQTSAHTALHCTLGLDTDSHEKCIHNACLLCSIHSCVCVTVNKPRWDWIILFNFQMTNNSQFHKNVQKCFKLELEKHIKVVQTE